MRILFVALLGAVGAALPFQSHADDGPAWWTAGDSNQHLIDTTKPSDNSSPANLGQVSWMTLRLHEELDQILPEGVGFALSFDFYDNLHGSRYSPVNLGQLKALAKPFYDRLNAVAPGFVSANLQKNDLPSGSYPWSGQQSNYSLVTIGQVKSVFGLWLEMDQDQDGMKDILEYFYFGNLNQSATGDVDNDGTDNQTELAQLSDPTDPDSGGITGSTGGIVISATVNSIPQNTPRDAPYDEGWPDPDPPQYESDWALSGPTDWTQSFHNKYWTAPHTLILVEDSANTIQVEVAAPSGTNLKIRTFRDPVEVALYGTASLSYDQTGSSAEVNSDQVGSHLIAAFDDVNNNNEIDVGEASVVIPVICISIELDFGSVIATDQHCLTGFASVANEIGCMVAFGGEIHGVGEAPNDVALSCQATVRLIGGNLDGKRGLDRIYGGWLQNLKSHSVRAVYIDGVGDVKLISNKESASGKLGLEAVYFRPGDPAPVELALPLLDSPTPTPTAQHGGKIMLSSGVESEDEDETIGVKRTIYGGDSPKLWLPIKHLANPLTPAHDLNKITSMYIRLDFDVYLCFWTNHKRKAPNAHGPGVRTFYCPYLESWVGSANVSFDGTTGDASLGQMDFESHDAFQLTSPLQVHTLGAEVLPPTPNANHALDFRN